MRSDSTISPLLRVCRLCGEPKAASAFFPHPTMRDGLSSKCRVCSAAECARRKAARRDPEIAALRRAELEARYLDRAWRRFCRWFTATDPGDCWPWRGRPRNGYGRFNFRGKFVSAHCFAYQRLVGPIPEGFDLDHTCRNRACVNPAHLEPVPPVVNVLRGEGPTAINARKTHCPRGHEYDMTTADGRWCTQCKREAGRAYREKKRIMAEALGVPARWLTGHRPKDTVA